MEGELDGLFDLRWLLRGVKGASMLPRDLARSAATALLFARLSALARSAAVVPLFAPTSARAFAARVLATAPVERFCVGGMSATGGRKETRGTLVGQIRHGSAEDGEMFVVAAVFCSTRPIFSV